MQISDQLIERLMVAARGIAWDKGVTVSEAEIARQHTRQVLEAALSATGPIELRNDDVGFVDFLNSDRPYICRKTEGICYLLIDRETRYVIGYRKYDDSAPQAPSVAVMALQDHVLADFTHLTDAQALSGPYIVKRIKERFGSFTLSAQVQDVAGWKPIETAPTDGTSILLRLSNGEVFSGWGVVETDGSKTWRRFHATSADVGWLNARHWMPLPAAPAKQEG